MPQSIKSKRIIYFLTFIPVVLVLFSGYAFLENIVDLNYIFLALLFLSVILVCVLQYVLKQYLISSSEKANLQLRFDELKTNFDEAEKLAEHKSIYLANMSYEARTPLSTVIGMLNMLRQTELNADQIAQVEIAEYSSKHLLQLLNMATDNADIVSGDLKLNLAAIDLKLNLSLLFKVFEYQAWEKGLEFDFKFLSEEKDKFSVICDFPRIQQVLINLINNAIKFTNTGKISIIVDQTIDIDEDQIVTFYVKDTGIGMKPHEVKQVFRNSKNTINSSILRDYRGGGIGLLISSRLVKLLGGDLRLESKENEGSAFYFSLQLKKTLNLKTETEFKPALQEKFNVLVAEDNRMNQKVIKFLLERQGADCTFVKNGIEAVELYKILDFDMVFMDIYMPDMDGYEATKAIKATKKHKKYKTPIIAVSASAFEADVENAKLAGIDDFLAKPIETLKLKKLLIKYSKK